MQWKLLASTEMMQWDIRLNIDCRSRVVRKQSGISTFDLQICQREILQMWLAGFMVLLFLSLVFCLLKRHACAIKFAFEI